MDKIKVLIIEDESISAEYLKQIVEDNNEFKVVDIAMNANDALQSIKKYKPKIVFVDIMIKGGLSGAEFALKIHNLYDDIIIIFLTAYSEDEMIEYASEANAFAYLLKPYRPNEIKATLSLAKVKLIKSKSIKKEENIIKLINGYSFNLKLKKLYHKQKEISLSIKERELLELLCKNSEVSLSKEAIQEYMNISDTSLRSLIYRLRKYLGSNIISNSKKFGYKIELDKEAESV